MAALIMSISGAFLVYSLINFISNVFLSEKFNVEGHVNRILKDEHILDEIYNISFVERMVKPFVDRMIEFITFILPKDQEYLDDLTDQLKQAGLRTTAQEYQASVILTVFLLAMFGFIYGILKGATFVSCLLYILFGMTLGFAVKRYTLKSAITKIKKEIYHQLPEVMDLLTVTVTAGMAFDHALSYISKKGKGALFTQLEIVQREIALGQTRKEALLNFSKRCNNQEIVTFVTAINQAEEMGSSVGNILDAQAKAIREAHKQEVEEKAQKLPVKMLIPLIFFVFPVLILVLVGPAVINIIMNMTGA